jgi:hypothetical protein
MGNWTKYGYWTSYSGPTYSHATRRVSIGGDWGTVGDNVRGWRKQKHYKVFSIAEDGTVEEVSSHYLLSTAKAAANRFLARSLAN